MMIAKFIGKDGSMGFRNGETYMIESWVERAGVWTKEAWIWVRSSPQGLKCPYSSLEAFLLNWEVIEVKKRA